MLGLPFSFRSSAQFQEFISRREGILHYRCPYFNSNFGDNCVRIQIKEEVAILLSTRIQLLRVRSVNIYRLHSHALQVQRFLDNF